MGAFKAPRGVAVAACLAVSLLTITASGATASGVKLCVPAAEGLPTITPIRGRCPRHYTLTELGAQGPTSLLSESEQKALKAILPYIKYVASGVGGKPTIQVSGANVQIESGYGKEQEINGAGNLVIGYDEEPGAQTGSNNLVLGGKQSFTSYGSILGGLGNTGSGADSFVVGNLNAANGKYSSVSGGYENKASGYGASVSGGYDNTASGNSASVSAGTHNTATEYSASVSGGGFNTASGFYASVSAGAHNTASGNSASVSGGDYNAASGEVSSVLGGVFNTVSEYGGLYPAP
jgi:hypothetical protein